jgi:ubiquitin
MFLVLAMLLTAGPKDQVSTVPCKTVEDCWLDSTGAAVARPKKLKRQQPPRGDCGAHLNWLRWRLTCDGQQHVCVSEFVGDRC